MRDTVRVERLMTQRELAEMLGMSVDWVKRASSHGEERIPLIRLGRSVRYQYSQVVGWLARHEVMPIDAGFRAASEGHPQGAPVHDEEVG